MPIKEEKTVQPCTRVELHGLLVDTELMIVQVPADKLQNALSLIQVMLQSDKVTLLQIQSICGTLNFFTKAIPGGRTFLRRLYDLTVGLSRPSHHVRLTSESKKDLQMWEYFLLHSNGSNIIKTINWSTDSDFKFYSDASGFAYAVVFGEHWIQGEFPVSWKDKSIAIKELVPIFLAFMKWSP
ncbi:MAG: hypothetical protein GY705_28605, partial [Bacteroidetes bacterium]|nr:hypothetical protein [Bacteroidota bacterium]